MTQMGDESTDSSTANVLEREWQSVTSLLARLGDDDWGRPTRCAGWTILDLTRHVVWGVSMEAEALRRARAGDLERADGRTMAQDSTPQEALEALRAAAVDLAAEARALGPEADTLTCPMPYGGTPVPLALDVFVYEAGIHASDFADAVGQDRPLAADVVPSTVAVLAQFLPVFATAGTNQPPVGTTFSLRGDTVELDGCWSATGLVMGDKGGEPTVRILGDDSSVLLYANGRLGVDDPRLSVSGVTGLARDFKTHVPGP